MYAGHNHLHPHITQDIHSMWIFPHTDIPTHTPAVSVATSFLSLRQTPHALLLGMQEWEEWAPISLGHRGGQTWTTAHYNRTDTLISNPSIPKTLPKCPNNFLPLTKFEWIYVHSLSEFSNTQTIYLKCPTDSRSLPPTKNTTSIYLWIQCSSSLCLFCLTPLWHLAIQGCMVYTQGKVTCIPQCLHHGCGSNTSSGIINYNSQCCHKNWSLVSTKNFNFPGKTSTGYELVYRVLRNDTKHPMWPPSPPSNFYSRNITSYTILCILRRWSIRNSLVSPVPHILHYVYPLFLSCNQFPYSVNLQL